LTDNEIDLLYKNDLIKFTNFISLIYECVCFKEEKHLTYCNGKKLHKPLKGEKWLLECKDESTSGIDFALALDLVDAQIGVGVRRSDHH
jgi:hypothetical protein